MESRARIEAIDQFRGLAALIMVLGNDLMYSGRAPTWLTHAHDPGFTAADFFAPLFIFAMAIVYGPSMRRRAARDGAPRAFGHAAIRWLILMAIGSLITIIQTLLDVNPSGIYWGVLEAIGAAGLLTLPVILLPAWGRLTAGLLVLAGYQLLLDRFWLQTVLRSPHGGVPGALGWGAMLMLSTVFGDLFLDEAKGRKFFLPAAFAAMAGAIALDRFVPISKVRVSASYVLLSVAISALSFWAVWILTEKVGRPSALLRWWGRNPLLLYLLHICFLALFLIPGVTDYLAAAPFAVVAAQDILLASVLSGIAWILYRKEWTLSV